MLCLTLNWDFCYNLNSFAWLRLGKLSIHLFQYTVCCWLVPTNKAYKIHVLIIIKLEVSFSRNQYFLITFFDYCALRRITHNFLGWSTRLCSTFIAIIFTKQKYLWWRNRICCQQESIGRVSWLHLFLHSTADICFLQWGKVIFLQLNVLRES